MLCPRINRFSQRRYEMSRGLKQVGVWLAGSVVFSLMVAISVTPLLASEAGTPMQVMEQTAQHLAMDTETISGSVTELSKDAAGAVTSVSIKTENEGAFVVANDPKGEELKQLLNKKIEVTGTVHESEGQKIINVLDYKVLD
jgi:hypothetical protein